MRTKIFSQQMAQIICFVICLCLPCISNAANWWDNDKLIAKGFGRPKKSVDNPYQAKFTAHQAALMDAYRQLAEQAKEINITATKTIGSEIESGGIRKSKINAVIKGAEVLSEEFDAENNCIIVVSVPIYGVTDSISKVVFKPVDKENFPRPNSYKIAAGNYTGLIIDCGDSDLKPVLSPVIRNAANISVYSYSNLDYDKVIAGGVVTYAVKDTPSVLKTSAKFLSYSALIDRKLLLVTAQTSEKNIARAGNNPLIIKAEGMSDDNTCPVISTEDADKILSENQASHFLDEGAVVFTSYRVGGLRA